MLRVKTVRARNTMDERQKLAAGFEAAKQT